MVSSDDEAEALPLHVSDYHFEDDQRELISFSELPIQWSEGDCLDGQKTPVFLHGHTDNGLQKVYKHVIAWKFDISNVKPQIQVLSKENYWIKLQNPRKSYVKNLKTIRSILITVECLHYEARNPKISEKNLWDHLFKVFSLYSIRPSKNDLAEQTSLITKAVQMNDRLAKSKFLLSFIEEKPGRRKLPNELFQTKAMSRVNVNEEKDGDDNSIEDHDPFDNVCAFCDEGGDLLCCEGRCFRSFHATLDSAAAANPNCGSLGYSVAELDAIPVFLCKNCEYKQHQCFICGKLGSSDNSLGAEVFSCAAATCARFYHPHCVSKLLHPDNEVSAIALEQKIARGESFTCPVHKCCICKQAEDKKDLDLQFAVCRRCPKSYHRKCLPKKIAFEDDKGLGITKRAWEDLLPDRILIYCLEHKIDKITGTPVMDHIQFPKVEETLFKNKKTRAIEKKGKQRSESIGDDKKNKLKIKGLAVEKSNEGGTTKRSGKLSPAVEVGGNKNIGKSHSEPRILGKRKANNASKLKACLNEENKSSMDDRLCVFLNKPVKLGKQDKSEPNMTAKVDPASDNLLDAESEKRLLDLIKEAESSVTLEDIRKKYGVPSTHILPFQNVLDTSNEVESSVEAVQQALKRVKEGCSKEDAKSVCELDTLSQRFEWKIVNKLSCYVHEGDTIVDVGFGANDFSVQMKKKVEEMGKNCVYKNYDLIQPKNDFNFEKRDWMTVQPEEFPAGVQLIVGLNHPTGDDATLTNKFIDKALEFKPKLLVLVASQEAQRLDKYKSPYDLLWEDDQLFSGKSFYFPESVHANDKQIKQSNLRPPVLYLWSRPDCYAQHKAIAEKYGHISPQQDPLDNIHSQTEGTEGSFPKVNDNKSSCGKNKYDEKSKEQQRGTKRDRRESGVVLMEPKWNGGNSSVEERQKERPRHSGVGDRCKDPSPILSRKGKGVKRVRFSDDTLTRNKKKNGDEHRSNLNKKESRHGRVRSPTLPSSYGHQILEAEPSNQMNSSSMHQRRSPLDKFNTSRMTLDSEPQKSGENGSAYRPRPSQLSHENIPAGFALGPNEEYLKHHSAGWLEE
ncbi:hypothetical protein UlMin_003744 [Ulmus minor]